jgi:hypothetical protein
MSKKFVNSFPGGNSGFELEAELNAHAIALGCAVTDVPISYRGRVDGSQSKLSTYSDGLKILRRNIQLFKNEKPLIAFTLLGFPWLILSLSLCIPVINQYLDTGFVPRYPSLIAGIGFFVVSALLWISGVILERIKLNRNILLRFIYRSF